MSTPLGNYTHQLAGLKSWPALQPLDYNAFGVASTDTKFAIAGRCGHLNSTGAWEAGVLSTGAMVQPPLFLLRTIDSFDVSTSVSNSFGGTVMPRGNLGALVGFGAFELYTTEFDTSIASITPGMVLKSPTRAQTSETGSVADKTAYPLADSSTQAGKLYTKKNWTGGGGGALAIGTDTIVGIASMGRTNAGHATVSTANWTNPYGVANLAFWPHYIHGTA